VLGLLQASPGGDWTPVHEGRLDPQSAPSRAGGSGVEVHLPAAAEPVTLIGAARVAQRFAADGVAEVGQAEQWAQSGCAGAESAQQPNCGLVEAGLCSVGRGHDALLIPRTIGRRPGDTAARVAVECVQHAVQPAGSDQRTAFQQHEDVGGRMCCEAIQACGATEWNTGSQLRQVVQTGEHAEHVGCRSVREQHHPMIGSGVAFDGTQRRQQGGRVDRGDHADEHRTAFWGKGFWGKGFGRNGRPSPRGRPGSRVVDGRQPVGLDVRSHDRDHLVERDGAPATAPGVVTAGAAAGVAAVQGWARDEDSCRILSQSVRNDRRPVAGGRPVVR